MTWAYRPGLDPQEQLRQLEQELSFENLYPDVDSAFQMASQQKANIRLVDDSGTLYHVVYAKGKRYRVALTEF